MDDLVLLFNSLVLGLTVGAASVVALYARHFFSRFVARFPVTRQIVPYASFIAGAGFFDVLYFGEKLTFLCLSWGWLRVLLWMRNYSDGVVMWAGSVIACILGYMMMIVDPYWANGHYPRLWRGAPLYNAAASETLALLLLLIVSGLFFECVAHWSSYVLVFCLSHLLALFVFTLPVILYADEAENKNHDRVNNQKVHGHVPPVTAEKLNEALGGNAPMPRQGERRMPSPNQCKFYD